MSELYVKLGWVKPEIIEKFKGLTPGAMEKRRVRGKLIQGIHWKKVQGIIMYHYENLDQLFEDDDGIAA